MLKILFNGDNINSLNTPKSQRKINFAFLLLLGIQMVVIAGLRGLSVGTDTKTYYDFFNLGE